MPIRSGTLEESVDGQELENRKKEQLGDRLPSGLAFLSVAALFCLSLEVELLQQVDGLRLYLTNREIVMEAGVALLFSLAIAFCWWLLVWLGGKLANGVSWTRRFRLQLQWYLWIAVPLSYLLIELFQDFKLEFFPLWHAGTRAQGLTALTVILICVAGLLPIGWPVVQRFCRTRLVPIGWAHIILGGLAAVALWVHGVRLFRDYARPGDATAVSSSPDIYLITIDTLRAEDTSVYGYDRATTPNLAKFAERSFVFDNFYANSNFTTPSMTSIGTGKLPWSHRVYQGGGFLRDRNQEECLAAELKRQGYYTAMISSNLLAAPFRDRTLGSYDSVQYASPLGFGGVHLRATNLVGVNSQFTLRFSLLRALNVLSTGLDLLLWRDRYPFPPEEVFGRATNFLSELKPSQPVFLWSHIFPPHAPYWVPTPYRHRFLPEQVRSYNDFTVTDTEKPGPGDSIEQLRAAYDEMVLYADHAVGEYLDWLDRTGRLNRSIVIISADHGEFFDHHRLAHGGPDLYDGVIHVPLLIHLPGQRQGGRVTQISEQADLLPTLLDILGAPIPSWTDGTSLKPALENKSEPDRYIFSMNLERNRIFDPLTKGTVAMMDGNFKLLRDLETGKEQLFRYKTDKGEENDIAGSEPDVAARLHKVLLDKISEVNKPFSGNQ